MGERYTGLPAEDRGGCAIAAAIGLPSLLLDCFRIMGDPAPGQQSVAHQFPVFLPTLVITVGAFVLGRMVIRWLKR